MHQEIVILGGARTPMAEYSGTPGYGLFKDLSAIELGAIAVRAALERTAVKPEQVDQVFMGNALQTSADAIYGARHVGLKAGLPIEVPALTVNRLCGSGIQSVISATHALELGEAQLCVAGGMENMDAAPYLIYGGRWGYRMGHAQIYDAMLHDGLNDAFSGEHSGWHAEDLASKYQITREAQDAWALRSQWRFSSAQASGKFEAEIAPVMVKSRKGPQAFARDEHNRPETTADSLARLKPAFRKEGTITAGNAPGLNAGAAAMLLASRKWADRKGVMPLGRLVSWGLAAVEPGMFGLAPVPAVKQALARAGWKLSEVDRFEINEAFAAIAIAVMRDLGIPEDVVNVEGNSIAHGHPIGATGALQTTRLLHSMARDGVKRGVVTMCIGGGQGIALCLERD